MAFYVLAEEELVLGFAFAGIKGTPVYTRAEALAAFENIIKLPDVQVLVITEEVSVMISEQITAWQMSGKYPLIVEIPGLAGHLENRKTLVQSIREAIGISV